MRIIARPVSGSTGGGKLSRPAKSSWGAYGSFRYLNWGAKFLADLTALLENPLATLA